MEQWHLSDAVVPTENSFMNKKWRSSYPPEQLFQWKNETQSLFDGVGVDRDDYPGRFGRPVVLGGEAEKREAARTRGRHQG
jgi:hypothetical protein